MAVETALPRKPTVPERALKWLWHQHVLGSVAIVLTLSLVIADQVGSRTDFANSELSKDVEARWGAPVGQAAPSVRYVPSGTVFTELKALALEEQRVDVQAAMNYRKRGLKYFSGFDFIFTGDYAVSNPEPHDIDAMFVFPVEVDKSQVLLSALEFEVLATTWSRVCVLELEPGTELGELPHIDDATVAPIGPELCLVSKKPGKYSFDVKLRAQGNRVRAGKDALWSTVDFEGDAVPQTSGGWTLIARQKPVVVERPPLEPSIWIARAQLVSTVEGRAQLSVTYHLKLDREQPISFTAPDGWRVDRVSVNGVARKTGLSLTVAPERDTDGTVELQLSRELGVFHLSGRLDFEMPRASWPVAEFAANVHLPAVFEYRRVGGSLEPAPEAPAAANMPGRLLPFRQFLIASSAPTVELEYSVDLKGRYFKMRGE